MTTLAVLVGLVACAGLVQATIGYLLVRRFRGDLAGAIGAGADATFTTPVTVLKPLCGSEPLLEEALLSLVTQRGGAFQIVVGVQDPRDPALNVIARVRSRFPEVDITVVVDPTPHGRNRKVANLINMLPAARHEVLVIADSDIHAPPGYLAALVAALREPGVGLVTTLYTGLRANGSVAARLGATALTHGLLPGALMARALGRQDCLGATMALRRDVLQRVGGLAALSPHLADDHVLGVLVQGLGLRVALASTVPATTVAERDISALYRHELRWARTISAIVPVRFALSTIQYPLVWAGLSVLLSGADDAALAVFLAAWATRAMISRGIDRALSAGREGLASPAPIWLLPARDLLSWMIAAASYLGGEVVWRGHVMQSGVAMRSGAARPIKLRRAGLTARKLGTEP